MKVSDLIGMKDVMFNLFNTAGWRDKFFYLFKVEIVPYSSNVLTIYYITSNNTIAYGNFHKDVDVAISTADEAALIRGRDIVMKNLWRTFNFYQGMIGSDPEMFVTNKDGVLIPAFDFLGSKKEPYKYANKFGHTNNVYWDGYQAEYDTNPNGCLGWHTDSIQGGMVGILDAAKKKFPDAKLSLRTVFDIPEDRLANDAEEHVSFGCMPSLNAYGMSGIKGHGRVVGFRSTGGHIHLGMGKKTEEQAIPIVKALDMVLGVAGVSMFAKYDDPRRRTMYGLAGEYRLPPHGIEYRVLSNAWMCHPLATNIVFDLARTVAANADYILKHWAATQEEVIEVINLCDVEKARAILKKNEVLFHMLLMVRYVNETKAKVAANVMINGIESAVIDPENIELNWRITGPREYYNHSSELDVAHLASTLVKGEKVA